MLTVMVPALNEEENIAKTVSNIVMSARSAGLPEFEIIVVNDGSTDHTGEILKNLQSIFPFLRVITHDSPKGIGYGFIEAIDQAKYDKITTFAGDNNSHWSLMEDLFKNIDKADLVTSYFINTEVRKRARNLLSTLFSTMYVTTFDLNVKYINGNAIYPVKMLKEMNIKSTAYSIFAEINTKLLRQDITFYELAGWSNPDSNRSQAIRVKTLVGVVKCFLQLVFEVYVTNKDKYKYRAKRVGMPQLDTKKMNFEEVRRIQESNLGRRPFSSHSLTQ